MGFFTSKKVKKANPNHEPPTTTSQQSKALPPLPNRTPQQSQQTPSQASTAPGQYWQQQQQQQQQHYGLTHPHAPQAPVPFQPAGYLPAPPGWTPPAPAPAPHYGYHRPQFQPQPIVVNQHYYLSHPSVTDPNKGALTKLTGSMVNIAKDVMPVTCDVLPHLYDDGLSAWHQYGTQVLNQTAAVVDQISSRFNHIMTMIDIEKFTGNEPGIFTCSHPALPQCNGQQNVQHPEVVPPLPERPSSKKGKKEKLHPKGQTTAVAASVVSGSYFDKVELYSNSRLPKNLPPLQLYVSTWPLLCLAAQYSERVYDTPRGAERDAHVSADWKTGTKAMVIKSVPMDEMNTIVFAIRGTATFMDWAVNLNSAPTSPAGFLDDPTNFCHSGFLSVARKMIKPVAARLRQLLEEDPGRSSYSLMITGHSAGGAVAALLYSHMLAKTQGAQSELNNLTGCFKRIHCVTFGTPPVSIIPLAKPDRRELRKSLFLAFINEGDPVARADKAYIKSLIELLAAPPPPKSIPSSSKPPSSSSNRPTKPPKKEKSKSSLASKRSYVSAKSSASSSSSSSSKSKRPVWKVPTCTLANAGRLVVLRSGDPLARRKGRRTVAERLNEGVVAMTLGERDLRGVVWGDPVCHVMRLYAGRIETLAVGAVTAKAW